MTIENSILHVKKQIRGINSIQGRKKSNKVYNEDETKYGKNKYDKNKLKKYKSPQIIDRGT